MKKPVSPPLGRDKPFVVLSFRQAIGATAVIILLFIIAIAASLTFAQTSIIQLAGGEEADVICDGPRLRFSRTSANELKLICRPHPTTPTPTAEPTDIPPTPTDVPPTPTSAPPTPTAEPTTPPSDGVTFRSTFDGDPAAPVSWPNIVDFENWDVTVHRRSTDLTMQGVNAHHGPNCEPPMTTHYVDTYEGSVFQCKNHVMTTLNDTGYGVIYLTPNQILDFSNGQEAVFRFDMSTLKTSSRDWIDLWITPFDENLQLPLDRNVDLQGRPNNTVQILMIPERGFVPFITRDGVTKEYRYGAEGVSWWVGYDDILVPDPKRRDTFELRISESSLKFCMPDYDMCYIDMPIETPLGWNQGIIQVGHHSYNPTKDGAGTANTWHWDNFEIENGIPFTNIKADRRYANPDATGVQFDAPAPANAHLRFAGIGSNLEVSFDGGVSWEFAQFNEQGNDNYHFMSYWTPIPEGTTAVQFRGGNWGNNSGPWHVRDIAIWSR